MPALSDNPCTRPGWSCRPALRVQSIATRHVVARWRMPRADVARWDGANGSGESIPRSFAIDSRAERVEISLNCYPKISVDWETVWFRVIHVTAFKDVRQDCLGCVRRMKHSSIHACWKLHKHREMHVEWNVYYVVLWHMNFMVKHISCNFEIHLQSRMISMCISGYFSRISDILYELSDIS